jgi:hypothetical protein
MLISGIPGSIVQQGDTFLLCSDSLKFPNCLCRDLGLEGLWSVSKSHSYGFSSIFTVRASTVTLLTMDLVDPARYSILMLSTFPHAVMLGAQSSMSLPSNTSIPTLGFVSGTGVVCAASPRTSSVVDSSVIGCSRSQQDAGSTYEHPAQWLHWTRLQVR